MGIIRKIANFSLRSTLTKYISLDFTDGEIHTLNYKRILHCQMHCPIRITPHVHTFTYKRILHCQMHCLVRLTPHVHTFTYKRIYTFICTVLSDLLHMYILSPIKESTLSFALSCQTYSTCTYFHL